MRRRAFLVLPGLAGGALLAACTDDPEVTVDDSPTPTPTGGSDAEAAEERYRYGDDESQFAVLHRPAGKAKGVVVVLHGGFWKSAYHYTLGTPLATSLAENGWAAWNLEYRRVGSGGGTPATFDDVATGINHLNTIDLGFDLADGPVVALGHSAGGHLAAWAASRTRFPRWSAGVELTHVISQAGVLDLREAAAQQLGGGAAQALLGREPADGDAQYDPQQQIPLDQPLWCVHGRSDTIVPPAQSADYVAAATGAGATAELVEVDGDHFVLIDPSTEAWTRTLSILGEIA